MGKLSGGGKRAWSRHRASPVEPLTTGHGLPGESSPEPARPDGRRGLRPSPRAALAGIIAVAFVVFGFRLLAPAHPGGDLLYHGALALGLLRDGLPLEGAYAGLPAYYPPGYHLALAMVIGPLGVAPIVAADVLFLVLLPILPLGTYLLTDRLTGRPWIAVLAVSLTLFGGAYNLNPIRQWVGSLFMSGQAAWTAYPRDLVFAILPLAVYAFVRALEPGGGRRPLAWALLSGLLLGIAALVQVQLLLPIPGALAAAALVVAVRDPARRGTAIVALVACGLVTAAIAAPWLLGTIEEVRRSGGVAIESSDQLEPARFGFWGYPREFGLILPLGIIGAGATLLFLRRPDGPRPGGTAGPWHPSLREGGVLLAAWWAVPFVLGVLYDPSWPLEDALRPQRLWLMASQPLAILGAIGLATVAEHALISRMPRLVPVAVLAVALVACLPATAATALLVQGTWTRDAYAMLDRSIDRVPRFDELLGRSGPRETVLAPEDWSALAWFETGLPVVGLLPPGYAKLAFDPAVSTGVSQAERRVAQVEAWSGTIERLVATADRFAARRIVIPRDGDRWMLVSLAAAALVRADPASSPAATTITGNGWDAVVLAPGQRLLLPAGITGSVDVVARTLRQTGAEPVAARLVALAVPPSGTRPARILGTLEPGQVVDDWDRSRVAVELRPGERLALEASGPVTIQGVGAWVPRPAAPDAWRIASETPEATVLERVP